MGLEKINKDLLELIRVELMAGKTFFEGYYERSDWNSLSRADRAICILQYLLDSPELGYPKGFESIRECIDEIKERVDEHIEL